MGHAVGERHVGARAQLQVDIGLARKPDIARVDDDKLRAALNRLTNAHAHNGMRLFGVAAHE